MTNKLYTKAIVLGRIDFGETDRILSILTPDAGKIHVLARGVRKEKSKLAGGIELFCEVEVGYINGRNELGTLVSSRLITYYKNILSDIEKVQLMYQVLKIIDKTTEDNAEREYYDLLLHLMTLADKPNVKVLPLSLYFKAQLLKLSGHLPNLTKDRENNKLEEKSSYVFDFNSMQMVNAQNGRYKSAHVKYLRLLFNDSSSSKFFNLAGSESVAKDVSPLIDAMMKSTLSI